MFKFFKRANKVDFEAEFFGAEEPKKIGKFIEWNTKKGIHKEYEFTANEKNLVGGWISVAKYEGNEYRVEYYN